MAKLDASKSIGIYFNIHGKLEVSDIILFLAFFVECKKNGFIIRLLVFKTSGKMCVDS